MMKKIKLTLTQQYRKITLQSNSTTIGSVINGLIIPILLASGYKKNDIIKAMADIVRVYKDGD